MTNIAITEINTNLYFHYLDYFPALEDRTRAAARNLIL